MPSATMQAVVKPAPAPGAEVSQVPVPEIGARDVLIRVRAASICGTDLHIYSWDRWAQRRLRPPLVFGHEFCGHVERVGDEVSGLKQGEFVSAEMHVACGLCFQCRTGQSHICQNVRIIGIDADGCFAEFVKIPATNVWKIDPAIPVEYAAILDPLGNAVHTVLAGEIAGMSVAITGAGPIGLFSIAIAKACGGGPVFVTEPHPYRQKLAIKMGADAVLDPTSTDAVAEVMNRTSGVGVDVVLEMSGHPDALRQGFQMLRRGGRISLLGIPAKPLELDLANDVIFKGAIVQGINGRRVFDTWYKMQALLKSGTLKLDPLITDRMPLADFDRGIQMLLSGDASKILLYPNGQGQP
ncbi:MAG TPA: L-threonine 3-dehydrogenase [Terriglobia bacterium]|nr:L-threonine 3-dehydrogenase [Terriglobia bacterium]